MKTEIHREGAHITIEMTGKIHVEDHELFQDLLLELKQDPSDSQFIFDFSQLEFVGSSGISRFVQHLKDFHRHSETTPLYQNVSEEFQKFIRAFDTENLFGFYDHSDQPRSQMDH